MANSIADAIAEAYSSTNEVAPIPMKRGKRVKYWRMCTRENCRIHRGRKGWITIGPTRQTPIEHSQFVTVKHMEELPDSYGVELDGGGPMTSPLDDGWGRYYTILANGGLKEFPADQIVALGWHKIPQLYEALPDHTRREVDALTSKVFPCVYGCFEDGAPKVFYKEELLARHIKAQHKDAVAAMAVGNAVKDAVHQPEREDKIAQVVAAAVAQTLMQMGIEPTSPVVSRRGRPPASEG